MKYFAERIFHQLFYYRKQYLVIWLELLLGVILLNLCVNRLLTSRALVEKAEEAMGAEEPMPALSLDGRFMGGSICAGELCTVQGAGEKLFRKAGNFLCGVGI